MFKRYTFSKYVFEVNPIHNIKGANCCDLVNKYNKLCTLSSKINLKNILTLQIQMTKVGGDSFRFKLIINLAHILQG
jgi:hypothetical protein